MKQGDWVEITPNSDFRWSYWMNSKDIYDCFRSKVGEIQNICEDDERPGHFLYSVKVNFPNGLYNLGPGHYYEWFRDYHLILSNKSRANLQTNMSQAGKELQEWEAFKKKSTHEMLKHIFTPKQETVLDNNKQTIKEIIDDPNQWDVKTPVNPDYYDNDVSYDYYISSTTGNDYSFSHQDISDDKDSKD
jgi:hypothetical protein